MDDLIHEMKRTAEKRIGKPVDHNPKPLFKADDVFDVTDILSKLLRAICVQEGITEGKLDEGLRDYLARKHLPVSKISSVKPNLMKAIRSDGVSFAKTVELFQQILGYDLSISIRLTRHDMKPVVYEYNDQMNEMAKVVNRSKEE